MLKDIIAVIPLKDHTLQITFEDGLEGTIDIAQLIPFNGIFAPLKELQFFQQVTVSPELGTICWPNGADLDPDVLYASLTHQVLEPFIAETAEHFRAAPELAGELANAD